MTRPASASLNGDGLDLGQGRRQAREPQGARSTATATARRPGIGHTRWATHGRVTEQNAHPLAAGDHDEVAIVLNGIIENHAELRRRLIADGERFASETDAEVVAHLVRHVLRRLPRRRRAAPPAPSSRATTPSSRCTATSPALLVGTRHQCPLLVGMGDGETFLASSITAFSGDTRRIKLIEDDEIVAHHRRRRARHRRAAGDALERDEIVVPWDDEVAEKARLRVVHAQGDPRAARGGRARRSRATSSTARSTLRRRSATSRGVRRIVVARLRDRVPRRPGRPLRASRRGPACRATSRSPASGATATRASRRARSSSASRSPARPPTRSPACGWRASAARARWRSPTRPARRSRARSTRCSTPTRASRWASRRRRRSPPRSCSCPCSRCASPSCAARWHAAGARARCSARCARCRTRCSCRLEAPGPARGGRRAPLRQAVLLLPRPPRRRCRCASRAR